MSKSIIYIHTFGTPKLIKCDELFRYTRIFNQKYFLLCILNAWDIYQIHKLHHTNFSVLLLKSPTLFLLCCERIYLNFLSKNRDIGLNAKYDTTNNIGESKNHITMAPAIYAKKVVTMFLIEDFSMMSINVSIDMVYDDGSM